MNYSFLPKNYQSGTLQDLRRLANQIKQISTEDLPLLREDLVRMDNEELIRFMESMNHALPLPRLVIMAVESRSTLTGFNYNYTLSMINMALSNPNHDDFDKNASIAAISKLVRGYRHRTNLNLLEGVSTALTKEAMQLISGHHEIDNAFADHLGRALTKKLTLAQADNTIMGLKELDIPESFRVFIKAQDKITTKDAAESFYASNILTKNYIDIVRQEVGDEILVTMARRHLEYTTTDLSLFNVIKELGEDSVISDNVLEEKLKDCKKLSKTPVFIKDILTGTKQSDIYPKSTKFVMDNLDSILATEPNPPSGAMANYAKENSRGLELIDKYINKTGSIMTTLQTKYGDESPVDLKNCTLGEILSHAFSDKHKELAYRGVHMWRNATVRAIANIGVSECSEILKDISSEAATAIYNNMESSEDRENALRKFIKIREVAFASDLGL